MAFDKFYLTTIGQSYLAAAQTGKALKFTKVSIGSGYLPNGQDITAVTALIASLKDLPIAAETSSQGTTTIKINFNNLNANGSIMAAFHWAEVGLYAKIDGDANYPEALVGYANALSEANADYIPATLTQFVFNFVCSTANASNVTAVIDQSMVFLTETSDLAKNVVTFTEASAYTAPASGDSEATLWGKVKKLFSSLGTAAFTPSTAYATAAQGTKADNALLKSLATAADQALVSSAAGAWVVKSLADIKTWLGLGSAAYKAAGSASGNLPVNGAALGTTANVPVVTNASGNLVPHASGALGTAAFTPSTAYQVPTNSLTAETALADEDYMPFYDTSAAGHRKTLWSNVKSRLKTYFDTLYSALGHTHTA